MYLCCTIGSCRFVNNGRIGSNHSTSSADMNNCPSGFGKVPFLRVAAEEEAENENENQLCCLSCLSITCLIFRILCVERTNERCMAGCCCIVLIIPICCYVLPDTEAYTALDNKKMLLRFISLLDSIDTLLLCIQIN